MLRDLTSPDVNAGFKVTQYPACNPVGSRKCGGVSWSDVGRKMTTATPVNPSSRLPSAVERKLPGGGPFGRVASLRMGIAAVGSI